MSEESRILVIGAGNETAGDDAAGILIARRLLDLHLPKVEVVIVGMNPPTMIDLFDGCDSAIVVDAVSSGTEAGTIHRFDAHRDELPSKRGGSTHGIGVAEMISLARALRRLPKRLTIIGIEGENFTGRELSAPVKAAIPRATGLIAEEIETMRRESVGKVTEGDDETA